MRRLLTVLAVGLAALFLFALLGGSLPEGNFLRDAADGLRAVGSNMADSFGGGYTQLPSG